LAKPHRSSNVLKQKISDVAERFFKEYGYEKTTFQMIADELGIGKGTITYHFKHKYLILYDYFQKFNNALIQYMNDNPPDNLNQYLMYCIHAQSFFREIIKKERSRELFFQEEQFEYWFTGQQSAHESMYRLISNDFHKDLSDEDILAAAMMTKGAVKCLFDFFNKGDYITGEKFCYQLIYMVGILSRLDESMIQRNIQRTYEYVDSHDMPTISLLE